MQKAIENTSSSTLFVGGIMIPPGEIRVIEEADLPAEHKDEAPAPAIETELDPLAELVAGPVRSVVAALTGLSAEELACVRVLEESGAQRKTLLSAIDAEKLIRASDAQEKTASIETQDATDEASAGAPKAVADEAAADATSAVAEAAGA